MSASVINITAARTARMLRANAPMHRIDDFLAHMTKVARQQHDARREAFWREVKLLVISASQLAN